MRQPAPPLVHRRPDYPPGLRSRVRGRLSLAGATLALVAASVFVPTAATTSVASAGAEPNDEHFDRQWHLRNTGQVVDGSTGTPGADVDAVRAWEVTTGSRNVVVGMIDSGIEHDHPDLRDNVWTNPGGINGCPAGTYGYDALNNTCNPKAGSHGTKMAGLVGAVGDNGIGVSGVAQRVRLMDLKVSTSTGTEVAPFGSDIIEAIDWAIRARRDHGVNVRVLSCPCPSGIEGYTTAMRNAIRQAGEEGMVFVASAGNDGRDTDQEPKYPCSHDAWNLICVAATDNRDELWSISAWGATSVDLAAPGVDVYTTCCVTGYSYSTGTSPATAMVAGAAALLFANGETSVATVKAKILHNVDKLDSLSGKVATGGRLNVYKALTGPLPPSPSPTPPTPTPPTPTDPPSTASPSPGQPTASPAPKQAPGPGGGEDTGGDSGGATSPDDEAAGAASQERGRQGDGDSEGDEDEGVLSSVARPLGAAAKAVTALPGAAARAVTRLPGATLRAVTNLPGAAVDLFTNPTQVLGWPWGRIAFFGLGTGLAAFGGYAGHRRGLFTSAWSRLPGWRRRLLFWRPRAS